MMKQSRCYCESEVKTPLPHFKVVVIGGVNDDTNGGGWRQRLRKESREDRS